MDFQEKLTESLKINCPYFPSREGRPHFPFLQDKHPTPPKTEAAVLALFDLIDGNPHLLITRRTQDVQTHKGQYAFPGGKIDQIDIDSESSTESAAALRETHEEVGISPESITLLGELPRLPTLSSGFWVQPYVGWLHSKEELKIQESELDWANWIEWKAFENKDNYRLEKFDAGKVSIPTHVFQIESHRIWGATAAMIKNLLDRLKQMNLSKQP